MENTFVPLGRANETFKPPSRLAKVVPEASLALRCCAVVVANLERYPPEAIGILTEEAWEQVIVMRHERTAPAKGKGGLDGTGRMNPAISERYLFAVEQANPQLAESTVADRLVWKDCVEFKFKEGGLSRPRELSFPWPVQIERIKRAATDLVELFQAESSKNNNNNSLERPIQILCESPMSVNLLQESGAGKAIHKFVKMASKKGEAARSLGLTTERRLRTATLYNKAGTIMSPTQQLKELLQHWKDMAANSGVKISQKLASRPQPKRAAPDLLRTSENCVTWRQLFAVLDERENQRRTNQGARMRELRKSLARTQPKTIRVIPMKSKHQSILNRPFDRRSATGNSATGNDKIQRLRHETAVATSQQKSSAAQPKSSAGFGSAVAFATGSKSSKKRNKTETLFLGNGKKMKIPERNRMQQRTKQGGFPR